VNNVNIVGMTEQIYTKGCNMMKVLRTSGDLKFL